MKVKDPQIFSASTNNRGSCEIVSLMCHKQNSQYATSIFTASKRILGKLRDWV